MPKTLISEPKTLHPRIFTDILHPTPYIHPKPQTLNPRPSILNSQS